MLRVKLRHLDEMTAHKRALAEIYFAELPDWVAKPVRCPDEYDVFHIYGIRHLQSDALRQFLLDHGIKSEVHYPISPHRQEAMKGILAGDYRIADELHQTELSLPISVGHSPADVREVCDGISRFNP